MIHRTLLRKILIWSGFVLLLWLSLPVAARRWAGRVFNEFQAPWRSTVSHLSDLQTYWDLRSRSPRELIEAGRDLARTNAALMLEQQTVTALEAEIRRLEHLLELPPRDTCRYEVARVATRDFTEWWARLTIRKGSNHGLEVGHAVVTQNGVAGRIREVFTTTAIVELVTSPGFRMSAFIEGHDLPIIYQGSENSLFSPPEGEALNIPPEVSLSSGQTLRVFSTGLGGVFPDGLEIGRLSSVRSGTDGYFKRGRVELPIELGSLREVAVIIPESAE